MDGIKKWITTGISFGTNNVFSICKQGISSYTSLFADDAKLLRKIRNHKDCEELRNYMKIYEWSKTWETLVHYIGLGSARN